MHRFLLICLALLLGLGLQAQTLTQTIRGRVIADTQEPLVGVQVFVSNLPQPIGTYTDSSGIFILENVPIGRRTVEARMVGYSKFVRDNINLNSAREYYLDITLQTGIELEEVVIGGYVRNDPVNELSVISTRRLDPEEFQYHAATGNDPGRLVQGMPGVQNGLDVRNDVVIRGNSPQGVLWRLEGIDILNPNHYAGPGSSGGGLTVFSASMLGSSDFSTGAFPAEYGNATSGVFDIHFRNGNNQNREYTFRAGILGLDFATEGPIVKGKSSYLANFRYSTLGILNDLGIHLLGPDIDNNFYDLSFKINHQGEKNQLSFWGLGGISSQIKKPYEGDWRSFRDYFIYDYGTKTGMTGASFRQVLDEKSYIQINAAVMAQNAFTFDDTLSAVFDTGRVKTERYVLGRNAVSAFYKRSFSRRFQVKAGGQFTQIWYNLLDEKWNDTLLVLQEIIDEQGRTWQAQPYVQASYRPSPRITINGGVHAMYFGLNGTYNIEPRLGAKFILTENTTFSLGYGLHSKTVPFGNYFIVVDGVQPNHDLELIKSHHFIAALDQLIGKKWRIRLEGYYQYLYDLPVVNQPNRKLFVLNRLWGYDQDVLESTGTGTNYGLDFSIEKFFDKGSFFVLSGSWVNAFFYLPYDDTRYNSSYNAAFSSNFTGGQVFQVGDNAFLETGLRLIYNTGYPVHPILESRASRDGYDPPINWSRPNSEQLKPYIRPDLRVALRLNRQKFAYWLALDIQNFIDRQNEFAWYRFNVELDRWARQAQTPLTPVLTFWLDF